MKKEDQRRNCCTVTAASLSKIASSLNLIAVRARPRAQTEPFEAHNTQSLPMARGNSARRPAYFLMAVEQEPTLCIKSQQGYQAEGKRLDREISSQQICHGTTWSSCGFARHAIAGVGPLDEGRSQIHRSKAGLPMLNMVSLSERRTTARLSWI